MRKRTAIKTELERWEILYNGTPFAVKYILDEDIRLVSQQQERRIALNTIEGMRETENFIVLIAKGSMTVSFHKNGFTEGTYEGFLNYIKAMLNNKRQKDDTGSTE